MAKIELGVLGPLRGKVGPVVGSSWKGIHYLRSKGPSTRSNNSAAQKDQQAKFRVAVRFAVLMSPLFEITFRNYAKAMTERNFAITHILQAIEGTYPNYGLTYSKIPLSLGTLEQVTTPAVSVAAGKLTWSWINNAGVTNAASNDQAILVAYCDAAKRVIYKPFAAIRSAQSGELDVTEFIGEAAHTWICFVSENGRLVTNSVHTGMITVV